MEAPKPIIQRQYVEFCFMVIQKEYILSEKFSGTLEDFDKRKIKLEKKIKQALEKSDKTDNEETKGQDK